MCGYGGYLGYLDVRELKLIALIYSTLGQRDMRSFANDDMSDRANNFELATNNLNLRTIMKVLPKSSKCLTGICTTF